MAVMFLSDILNLILSIYEYLCLVSDFSLLLGCVPCEIDSYSGNIMVVCTSCFAQRFSIGVYACFCFFLHLSVCHIIFYWGMTLVCSCVYVSVHFVMFIWFEIPRTSPKPRRCGAQL